MNDHVPSLSELAAEAANGWACPKCGCDDWRTINTYRCVTDGTRHRRQYCRHCLHVRITYESPKKPE